MGVEILAILFLPHYLSINWSCYGVGLSTSCYHSFKHNRCSLHWPT